MKLALIRRQFSATGGAELYLQRLLRALAAQNHELHLFAESWAAVRRRLASLTTTAVSDDHRRRAVGYDIPPRAPRAACVLPKRFKTNWPGNPSTAFSAWNEP